MVDQIIDQWTILRHIPPLPLNQRKYNASQGSEGLNPPEIRQEFGFASQL